MMALLLHHSLLLCCLSLVPCFNQQAYAFTSPAQHHHQQYHRHARSSSATNPAFTTTWTVSDHEHGGSPWIRRPTTTATSDTALSLGFFEELVSKQDTNFRVQDNTAYITKLQEQVRKINQFEPQMEELGDDELQAYTIEFRQRLLQQQQQQKETVGVENDIIIPDSLLEEAFAVVREAAWRVLELRHYDVQLLGGLALHDGRLAEMATGEGKTLVATLPAYINALRPGKRQSQEQQGQMGSTSTSKTTSTSLIVTVNDYLARRDMEKMGQVYKFLGLTVGLVQNEMSTQERRQAYGCDIVYVTNSELGFDLLRDYLAVSSNETVLPTNIFENSFCLVDEADSILIDEARTPLIISEQVAAPATKYVTANRLGMALQPKIHYTVDLKNKNIVLTEQGYRECEQALKVDSLFTIQGDGTAWAPFITNAVKAKELFNKDQEYTVLYHEDQDKELSSNSQPVGVGIIDPFTGRVMDGRRWSDGLHQSIEAKENIPVSKQSKVIAKITYQALFRQFGRLAGMTGTAMADANELEGIYGLLVTPIPTALPIARRDYPDVVFKTRQAANQALIREVKNVIGGVMVGEDDNDNNDDDNDDDSSTKRNGRPCLIGTTSVAQSEQLVQELMEQGIAASLLNASPKNAARESEIIAQAGRLGVVTVATNMAGRGTDILLGGCPTTMARIKARSYLLDANILSSKEMDLLPPVPDEDYLPCPLSDDVEIVLQEAAAAVKESLGSDLTVIQLDELLTVAFDTTEAEDDPDYMVQLRDAAQAVVETYKSVLSKEKEMVQKLGGLYVLGTNRHESSRIDQQLRGRAGRQGDPGSSRFFLSFEDDMFRIFGGESLQKILTMFRVSDDMPVEAQAVTESLDRVQRQVEEKYREIRKEIFNFDEVLNSQRRVIYDRRRRILMSSGQDGVVMMREYNNQTIQDIVNAQRGDDGKVKTSKVVEKVAVFFPPVAASIRDNDLQGMNEGAIASYISKAVDVVFMEKVNEVDKRANLVGKGPNSLGRSATYITLVTMDNAWSNHLLAMESLKESVLLRKYQGRDPVAEYQKEAFILFQGLEDTMRFNAVYSLWQSLSTSGQLATQSA